MSVAAILQALAENAGRQQMYRGAVIGNTISQATQIPAQMIEDRRRQAVIDREQAQRDTSLRYAGNADDRARQDQEMQNAANSVAVEKNRVLRLGIAAGFGKSTNPKDFDEPTAIQTVIDAGHPELAQAISETHRTLLPKLTSGAKGSMMRDESGHVIEGSEIPEDKPDYTLGSQRFSGKTNQPITDQVLTPSASTSQMMRLMGRDGKTVQDVPISVVPTKDGKGSTYHYLGEDVSDRVRAIPPASVQVNNQAMGADNSTVAKAIADYRIPPPSPRTMTTAVGEALMRQVMAENPDYDTSKFTIRADTRKKYTTGQQGQQIASLNTAIEHLDLLQAAADALNNGSFKPGNAIFNKVKDTFGSGAPTSFDAIKEKLDKDLDAVASKGVPTVSGAAAQAGIGGKAASPEAIKSYIDTSIKLMAGSLDALVTPYRREMGERDPFKPLTSTAEQILKARGFDPTTMRSVETANGAAPLKVGGFTVTVKPK